MLNTIQLFHSFIHSFICTHFRFEYSFVCYSAGATINDRYEIKSDPLQHLRSFLVRFDSHLLFLI